ncbi:hypothetical protein OBBRIDRAFT_822446 [Obba rivulosa]|uniref:Uncharacterized protein n=1 Tax=Obba rivulosa TaxID=1052685 RepID=A0A8E2J722_9APHY|nr:hypothetical protein OBBRIDRAFT_822446 [Obba rivulosa]
MSADARAPPPAIHRLVSGHNENGVSVIRTEDIVSPTPSESWPGVISATLWNTNATPTDDNNDDMDGSNRRPNGDLGIVMKNGTSMRYTDLAPGATASLHRTSSLDYNILISGKLVLILDNGVERLFETPGDLIIQRGTIHAWRNPGPEWTRWATVLIDARPAVVGGKALEAEVRT